MSVTSSEQAHTTTSSSSTNTKRKHEEQTIDDSLQQEKALNISDRAEILTVEQPRTKPNFVMPSKLGSASLHDRLQSFLPQMERSNKSLANGQVKNMEDVDENEQHIVMDLGLGVLEQQSSSQDSSSASEESSDEDDRPELKSTVMDTLLGKKTNKEKPDIQEIS